MDTSPSTHLFQQGMDLLTQTIDATKKILTPIMIGAVAVALLMTVVQSTLSLGTMKNMGMMGLDMEKLEKLEYDGDGADAMRGMMEATGTTSPEAAAAKMAGAMGGMLGTLFIVGMLMMAVSILVNAVASTYYMVVYLRSQTDVAKALQEVGANFIPMIAIWIVTFVRSLVWIPVIGIVFGILWFPRMALAPYIYLTEKPGVMKSISLSFDRTKGRWSQIVVPILVVGIIIWIVTAIATMILSTLVSPIPYAPSLLGNIAQQIAMAISTGAIVGLAPRFAES